MSINDIGEKIGKIVYENRIKNGMSQSRLAKRLGISHTYLVQIEHGNMLPSDEILVRIAKEFNIDEVELIKIRGKMTDSVRSEIEGHKNLLEALHKIAISDLDSNGRELVYKRLNEMADKLYKR